MKRQIVVIFCVSALIFLLMSASNAQTRRLSLEELSKKSELIVTGKVLDQRSEWNDEKTRIYTRVTVSVDEYHKGEGAGETLTVTSLGGEVGEVGELYTGTARFEKDEEVFLFLKKDQKDNYRVTGSNLGKYKIRQDEQTGKKVVGLNRTLDDFSVRVKDIVKRQKLE